VNFSTSPSTRELFGRFSGLSRTAQAYGFANGSGACVTAAAKPSGRLCSTRGSSVRSRRSTRWWSRCMPQHARGLELAGENILTACPPKRPQRSLAVRHGPGGAGRRRARLGGRGVMGSTTISRRPSVRRLGPPAAFSRADRAGAGARRDEPPGRVCAATSVTAFWRARLWRVGQLDDVLAEAMTLAAARRRECLRDAEPDRRPRDALTAWPSCCPG
jgi:hypothetical protein